MLCPSCSYRSIIHQTCAVIEAANVLQAWRVLEDLTNHIDLVLTELEMPCVSGIVLLCKIMSHKTRKNVPVIMMSSRDSMGLVFKCLSKGAVDFLVKPIRKNELKNLWQHVWRRCHSSSGSGSESGTQTQNSVKSKSIEKCGNNSGSSDGEDNGSDGLNIGDGSDDGSGAQSSWTKQAAEVDSSQAVSPWDQVTECPDSTCAQVIRWSAENSGNRKVHVAATKDCQEEKQPDNTKCKYPATTIPKKLETQHENPIGAPINSVGEKHTNVVEIDPSASNNRIEKEQIDRKEFEAQKMVAAVSEIENNTIHESRKAVIEPSLKRPREMKESRETSQDDRYIFRRSEQSAFTRYNTSSQSNPLRTPNGLTGNSLVIDSGLESANNVVSNNIDMGSTTNKLATKPLTVQDKSEATCTTNANALNSDSSNVMAGPFEGTLGNHSLNKSASGSNHGSNGQNGSSTAVNVGGNNGKTETGYKQGKLKNIRCQIIKWKAQPTAFHQQGFRSSSNEMEDESSSQPIPDALHSPALSYLQGFVAVPPSVPPDPQPAD
nr:two-component response regulator-like APRR7 isoform X2 [Ipomoea trifida]